MHCVSTVSYIIINIGENVWQYVCEGVQVDELTPINTVISTDLICSLFRVVPFSYTLKQIYTQDKGKI